MNLFKAAEKLAKIRKEYISEVNKINEHYGMGFHTITEVSCFMLDESTKLMENEAKIMSDFNENECIQLNAIANYIEVKNF